MSYEVRMCIVKAYDRGQILSKNWATFLWINDRLAMFLKAETLPRPFFFLCL